MQQILGFLTLTGSIKGTMGGVPDVLPPGFMKPTRKVVGNKGRYTRTTAERRTAPITKYGAPARRLGLRDVGEVDIKLIHTFGEQALDPLVLKQLRSKDAYTLDMGLDEVKRQVTDFASRFYNLRLATVLQILKSGVIYYDANGNLLPSSSGAVETHSFQMNANNQNQLNGIISASWALQNTNIPLQLRLLKQRARRLTGYPLTTAIYGENIPTYLTQNEYVIDYLARTPTMREALMTSNAMELPDGLFGLKWVPAYEAFYEDDGGTNRDLWSGDQITFTPDVNENWWEVVEGSFEVPTTINIVGDAEQAMRSLQTVYGAFGYGVVTHNPPTVIGFAGDTFIGCLKVPDAIYQADVTP